MIISSYPMTLPDDLRFQLVGRLLGEHADLRTVFCEEVGNHLRVEGQRRIEVIALHIVENGLPHLTGHYPTVEIFVDIHRCHQQFTLQLLRRRYSESDIAKIWGGNWLRVMEEVQNAK